MTGDKMRINNNGESKLKINDKKLYATIYDKEIKKEGSNTDIENV